MSLHPHFTFFRFAFGNQAVAMFLFIKVFLLFVAAVGEASVKEFVYARSLPQSVDSSFSGCTVRTSAVRSKVDCVRWCLSLNSFSLTYTKMGPGIASCRCRSSRNRSVTFQGAVLSKKCGDNSCNLFSGSFWLGKACSRDTDCQAQYSFCNNGSYTCICMPGYYYSNSCDTCVPNCNPSSLGRTFLKYQLSCLIGHDDVTDYVSSSQQCEAKCIDRIWCLTFDYMPGYGRCDLSNATGLTSHDFAYNCARDIIDHYQRTCF